MTDQKQELILLSTLTLTGLLASGDWGPYASLMEGFHSWRHYGLFSHALNILDTRVLYQSSLHGQGHVERTLLLAALLGWMEDLSAQDTSLLLSAISYHDVGRVDDGYDTEHGTRSAGRLAELTGATGEDLLLMQGAVASHSRPDEQLEETVGFYHAANFPHAIALARLVKDADGLDRVRIQDLNPDYLRHKSAKALALFAQYLFDQYCAMGAACLPHWCKHRKDWRSQS